MTPGLGATIRTQTYFIEERSVASVADEQVPVARKDGRDLAAVESHAGDDRRVRRVEIDPVVPAILDDPTRDV